MPYLLNATHCTFFWNTAPIKSPNNFWGWYSHCCTVNRDCIRWLDLYFWRRTNNNCWRCYEKNLRVIETILRKVYHTLYHPTNKSELGFGTYSILFRLIDLGNQPVRHSGKILVHTGHQIDIAIHLLCMDLLLRDRIVQPKEK